MDTVAYNEFLRQKFEKTKDIEVLLRYVISETLSPIGDYENAVKIVREYNDDYQNPILLFIGAYWLIWWYHEKENDCLQINRRTVRMKVYPQSFYALLTISCNSIIIRMKYKKKEK